MTRRSHSALMVTEFPEWHGQCECGTQYALGTTAEAVAEWWIQHRMEAAA